MRSPLTLKIVLAAAMLVACGCTGSALAPGGPSAKTMFNPPSDAREITFPAEMSQWLGGVDVTQADELCLAALPNLSDQTSATQTTQEINCEMANLAINYRGPASLYFPPGVYYINDTPKLYPKSFTTNSDGSQLYHAGWAVNGLHISGRNPGNTLIAWVGSCEPLPNVCAGSIKYPSMV